MTDLVNGLEPMPLSLSYQHHQSDVDYRIYIDNHITQIKKLYKADMSLLYPVYEGSLIDLLLYL